MQAPQSTHPFCSSKLNTDGHSSIWFLKLTAARRFEMKASFPHLMHLTVGGGGAGMGEEVPHVPVIIREQIKTLSFSLSLRQRLNLWKLKPKLMEIPFIGHHCPSTSPMAMPQEQNQGEVPSSCSLAIVSNSRLEGGENSLKPPLEISPKIMISFSFSFLLPSFLAVSCLLVSYSYQEAAFCNKKLNTFSHACYKKKASCRCFWLSEFIHFIHSFFQHYIHPV